MRPAVYVTLAAGEPTAAEITRMAAERTRTSYYYLDDLIQLAARYPQAGVALTNRARCELIDLLDPYGRCAPATLTTLILAAGRPLVDWPSLWWAKRFTIDKASGHITYCAGQSGPGELGRIRREMVKELGYVR